MPFTLTDWNRKSYSVKVVRVTEANMAEIAKWTRGTLRNDRDTEHFPKTKPQLDYIEVPVETSARRQKSKAYVGDWVTKNERAFAVYSDPAFKAVFRPSSQEMLSQVAIHVMQAMAKQDKATNHGDTRGMDLVAFDTARKIIADLI